ncbi:methylated-DNA--[protein]-cysteine S-methyltransferase [Roseivirga misakiensis]|uniref:Methylated-DNA--protein-cysteine methyltransferase n=1 Tax=Roseivirga misakiensis TaxID=1563681 RepID=A0A1E5T3C8_9BACT|nr:methylated-DNA--[protein]-cysteine S-methyltransferase [Roseivirga misakiensis]OEK05882.1 cysteine methyltransferase [Roseivirga misakiensis]
MKNTAITYMDSPLGRIKIIGDADAIKMVSFIDREERESEGVIPLTVRNCKKQLKEYFEGKRKEFNVPLDPDGTAFQKEVWQSLLSIPFGKTSTYAKQSKILGDIKKIRAVGSANGKNPIAVIIPCHRVIGTDGSLTGYAGGLDKKEWLLRHEKSMPGQNQTSMF